MRVYRGRTFTAFTVVAVLQSSAVFAADADLILHHGKILTVDGRFSVQQAIAMKAGRITKVGSDAAVLSERGAHTQVIDLHGRTVLPGLIDSHVHPLSAGLSEFRSAIPKLDSYSAVQNYIRQQAKVVPAGQWIIVPRTFPTRLQEMRMPTRETLDVEKDHPVKYDASYVSIVNTKGLQISGITRETPNPPGGEIVKDSKGEPNGILKNADGLLKGVQKSEVYTRDEQLQALEGQLHRYVEAGLTSVIDRALTLEEIPLYDVLQKSGKLPLRVTMTWRMDTKGSTEELVKRIEQAPVPHGDDWLRLAIFKVTLDGGMTIGTAYQRVPYGEFGTQLYGKTNPDDRGQLFVAPDKLTAIMRAARNRGWSLTAHSQGGGAIDNLLETFRILNAEKPLAPTRSHIMHASFQSPDAIAKAKKLGTLADVQAAWLYQDAPALTKVFGEKGMKNFFPLRSYVDAGIIFAGGSDHMIGHGKNSSMNPYNPFLGLWTSVTRVTSAGNVAQPGQRISRENALRSYTIWGAYLQNAAKQKGSLEPGKLADFVVIDRDYMTCPEQQIRDIEPVTVIINGKVAYEKAAIQ